MLAPVPGRLRRARVLKPDLFLRIGVGAYEDRWFVEVDLATESAPTIAAKAERYLEHYRGGGEQRRHGVYPRVIWTVPNPRAASRSRQALARLPEGSPAAVRRLGLRGGRRAPERGGQHVTPRNTVIEGDALDGLARAWRPTPWTAS